jgi:hypothetical protein
VADENDKIEKGRFKPGATEKTTEGEVHRSMSDFWLIVCIFCIFIGGCIGMCAMAMCRVSAEISREQENRQRRMGGVIDDRQS